MNVKKKSYLLTVIQFTAIGIMIIFFPIMTKTHLLMGIQIAGLIIGAWALITMFGSRFNVTPEPLQGSTLITTGPYKLIRHPMYLSLLLLFTPALAGNFSTGFALVYVLFIINQMIKMYFEETLLTQHFRHYAAYRKRTWKMIPFIF